MSRMIFVNLPVADLAASKCFYEAVGFTNNPQFSEIAMALEHLGEHCGQMVVCLR
jgi:predicted lactoylglutathione lyase